MTPLYSGFPVPLTSKAWEIAQGHVQPQFDAEHNQQQFRNELARYAVDFYLRCMAFEIESRPHPILSKFVEGAELGVKNFGKLECCPVPSGETHFKVPVDAWCDRIAYIIVQIEDHFKQAQIIGFSPQPIPANGEIPLNQLQAVDALPQYLYDCKTTGLSQVWAWAKERGQALSESVGGTLHGWHLTQEINLAFMGSDHPNALASKACLEEPNDHALVSKSVQLQDLELELVMDLSPKEDGSFRIELMLESELGQPLPEIMQLAIIDDTGRIFQQLSPESDLIARPFSAQRSERFSIELSYDTAKHTETFVI